MKGSKSFRRFLASANAFLEGVLYPQGASCQVCGEGRMVDGHYALCEECMKAMEGLRIPASACEKCLFPTRKGACSMCVSRRMKSIDSSYAPFCYRKQVRKLIHEFKFEHNASFLPYLADQMANALSNRDYDMLVPVPLHKKRLQDRGRNQSLMLAQALSERTGIQASEVLERTQYQKPQSETPMAQRAMNVAGSFRCLSDLTDKKVLLIDDVRTTGSTAQACALVMKRAGAAKVGLCTVAVVYRDPRKMRRTSKKVKKFIRRRI